MQNTQAADVGSSVRRASKKIDCETGKVPPSVGVTKAIPASAFAKPYDQNEYANWKLARSLYKLQIQNIINGEMQSIEKDILDILKENGAESAVPAIKAYLASRVHDIQLASPIKTVATIRLTRQISDLRDERISAVVEKFLSFKGKIDYQRARGRAALPVDVWLMKTFVDSGKLLPDELKAIPMWAYRQFDQRLYQALMNKKRPNPR